MACYSPSSLQSRSVTFVKSKRALNDSNSSHLNTDDDGDDDDEFNEKDNNDDSIEESKSETVNKKKIFGRDPTSRDEKRRLSHSAAEQKRRNAIKSGYDELQKLCPNCNLMDPSSSQKICKSTILKRSIDYIEELENEKECHEKELELLKNELMAIKILKSHNDQLLNIHQKNVRRSIMENSENNDLDESKFHLFVKFSNNLFRSFETIIKPNSFFELSGSMFFWLEQVCSANNLRNLVLLSLFQLAHDIMI